MNRAPVALFALLCTLASSMVAAGVASDRPATAAKPMQRNPEKTELKTVSYSGSPQEKWLTEAHWQSIDVQRAVALPTKKIPTRIPENVKPVTAIIITIEQTEKPAPKTVAQPATAKPTVVAKPTVIAKPTVVSKPAAKPAVVQKPAGQKAVVAAQPINADKAKEAVMSVVSQVVAASKTASIQPRVSSSYSTTYQPNSTARTVLPSNRVSVADLHLVKPSVVTMNGHLTALPVQGVSSKVDNTAAISLGGGKLEIAYGSLNMISVGGKSFIASPFIADNASSILVNKGFTTSPVKSTAKVRAASYDFSIWTWSGRQARWLHVSLLNTVDMLGDRLSRHVNQAATGYAVGIQSFSTAAWLPKLTGEYVPTIKNARSESGNKSSEKK